jgi:hypothetical protein
MTRDEAHQIIMSFPEVVEGQSYGKPAYKAFDKFFTRIRRQDQSVVIGCVPIDEREMLIELDPETFHVTAHYKDYNFVLARLSSVEPEQLKSFLTRQWRKNAPKTWLKKWEAEHAAGSQAAGAVKAT